MGSQTAGHNSATELTGWVTQSCPTLCDLMNINPPGSCPWNSPGKKTAVGRHFLLQGIVLIQRWNPSLLHLLHWQANSLPLSHLGSSPTKNTDIYPQFKVRNSYLYITFWVLGGVFFLVVRKRAEQKETTEKGWIHSALDKTITKSSWFPPPPSDPSWFSFSKYSFCVLNMFYQYES